MFLFNDGFVDMWREGLGEPYYLYTLIDPRKGEACYIGITKQKFSTRLTQHRNPKKSNMARIAKLQRHLKKNNMTLEGKLLAKGSKRFIGALEKWCITGYWVYVGRNSLKNHQAGGFNSFGQDEETKFKTREAIRKKKQSGTYKPHKGEDIGTSKLTEKQVLKIYELIKDFGTNKEIIEKLNLDIGITGMNQIRRGINWKHLFERENMIDIPSLKSQNGAMTAKDKFKVLEGIEDGKSNTEIKELHGLRNSDTQRIREKKL